MAAVEYNKFGDGAIATVQSTKNSVALTHAAGMQATSWHLFPGSFASHFHARLMYQSGERQYLLQSQNRYRSLLLVDRNVVASDFIYRSAAMIPQDSAGI